MPTTCQVDFENSPSKVCYAGTLLRANVTITCSKEKIIRGIFAKVKGAAHAQWDEGSGDNRRTYTGDESYLDEQVYMTGGPNGMALMKTFSLFVEFFFVLCYRLSQGRLDNL